MKSYRQQIQDNEVPESKQIRQMLEDLNSLRNRISKHIYTDKSVSVEDGILLGKLESVIRILTPEVFKYGSPV